MTPSISACPPILLFLYADKGLFGVCQIVAFIKLVNAAALIDKFLLACKKRVAFGTNLHLDEVGFFGRTCHKRLAAGAPHGDLVVRGVDFFFHEFLFSFVKIDDFHCTTKPRPCKDFFSDKNGVGTNAGTNGDGGICCPQQMRPVPVCSIEFQ